jgi:uncharacterized membrane protein
MAPRSLETSIVVQAPRPTVFRWVGDYRNAAIALEGVRRWEPLDPARTTGAGARFSVRIGLLGVTVGTILEVDTWDEPAAIGWHADGGPVEIRGRWRFDEHPAGTNVTLFLEYEPPGGVLGRFGAGRLSGVARNRLREGLEAMQEALEDNGG